MNAVAAAFALPPALALGSFLGVVATRLPAGRSLLSPPSSCDTCSRELRWFENVPVLSYVLLRGRCRYCGAPISPVHPALELGTGLLVSTCLALIG